MLSGMSASDSDSSPLTAGDLLASPRGRAFVLGLATQVPEHLSGAFDEEGEPLTAEARSHSELADAVFTAGFLIDKANGAGVAMLLGDGMVEPEPEREPEPGSVTSVDVAEKLREVQPASPSRDEVDAELREVVDAARYWQAPDGDQLIADTNEVRAALGPFAQAVIDTGLLGDWSAPLDRKRQWALAWEDTDLHGAQPSVFDEPLGEVEGDRLIRLEDLVPVAGDADCRLPHGLDEWLADMLTAETDRRRDFAKRPFHQLSSAWWSTPPPGLWDSTSTWRENEPIGLTLVEDSFGPTRARACRLRIRSDAQICEIRRPEDWAELCRRHPLDVTAQQRSDWFEATGRRGRWVIPDWSQVAEEFDGVHVSLAGYLRTSGTVIDVGDASLVEHSRSLPTAGDTDERTASLMAGWNPDMTYWLNDVITGVAEVVEWKLEDDEDEWRRIPPW